MAEVIRGGRVVEDTQTGRRIEVDLGRVTDTVRKLNERKGYERYKAVPRRGLNRLVFRAGA